MAETLEAMATRLAAWFDADDEDRFPTEVRYWCINQARDQIIRNNDLRWGYHKTPWSLSIGDYREAWTGSLGLLTWQKPIELWWYDATNDGVKFLEHLSLKDYDRFYPDPTSSEFQGQPAYYTTDADYLYITPASEAITLYIRWYGPPAELEAGGGTNSDNFLVSAAGAIYYTAMGLANDWFPGEERRDNIWEAKALMLTDELVMQEARNRGAGKPNVRLTPGHTYLE